MLFLQDAPEQPVIKLLCGLASKLDLYIPIAPATLKSEGSVIELFAGAQRTRSHFY